MHSFDEILKELQAQNPTPASEPVQWGRFEMKLSFLVVLDAPKVGDSHLNAPITKELIPQKRKKNRVKNSEERWIKTMKII